MSKVFTILTMKTLTITQLKQERPEVMTLPSGVTTWMAWIDGECVIHRGIGEVAALQSLCRAMHWDVEVVEDPLVMNPSDRDWTEDFLHENGTYQNRCDACGLMFNGHKRRMICKLCWKPSKNSIIKAPAIRTVTVSELLKEHPEVQTLESGEDFHPGYWSAWIPGNGGGIHRKETQCDALQSLANAEGWNVKVVEEPPRDIWQLMRNIPPYCTRCGKLPDGCVCQDGPRAIGHGAWEFKCIVCDGVFHGEENQVTCDSCLGKIYPQSRQTPTPRTDAIEKVFRTQVGELVSGKVGLEAFMAHVLVAIKDARTLERELAEKTEAAREFASANSVLGDSLTKVVKQKDETLSLVRRLVDHYDKRNAEMNGFKSPLTSMDEWMEEERSLEQEARKIVEGMKS